MDKRNFIMLLNMANPNKKLLSDLWERLKREADQTARPLWIDSMAAVFFISTDLPAWKIYGCVLPINPTHEQRQAVKDVLVMELGADHCGNPESKAMAWLNSHKIQPAQT